MTYPKTFKMSTQEYSPHIINPLSRANRKQRKIFLLSKNYNRNRCSSIHRYKCLRQQLRRNQFSTMTTIQVPMDICNKQLSKMTQS